MKMLSFTYKLCTRSQTSDNICHHDHFLIILLFLTLLSNTFPRAGVGGGGDGTDGSGWGPDEGGPSFLAGPGGINLGFLAAFPRS